MRRAEVDQQARRALLPLFVKAVDGAVDRADLTLEEQALFDQALEVDRDNTRWLIELVRRQGWPTRSHVGERAAHAAWLLVQHGDQDPAWQRRCLDLMRAAPDGEVSPGDVAYLTDRVLLAEGKPQVYGTQMRTIDGEHQPRDLRYAETVDQRRAAVGLGTLEEYRQRMNDDREVLSRPGAVEQRAPARQFYAQPGSATRKMTGLRGISRRRSAA